MKRVIGLLVVVLVWGSVAQPGLGQKKTKTKEPIVQGKALSEWVKVLKGKDNAAKFTAVTALMEGGKDLKPAVPALIDTFRNAPTFLHPLSALALGRIGPDALPDLRKGLTDKEVTVRGGCVLALGWMPEGATPAVPDLAKVLTDKERVIKLTAAQSLGRLGSSARVALPALRKLLDDKDPDVRVEAAIALIKVGREMKRAIPVLAAALAGTPATVSNAAEALGELGKTAKPATAALKKALDHKNLGARLAAAEAYWKVTGDGDAVLPVIEKALTAKESDDRRKAIAVLGFLNAKKGVVEKLVKLLGDKSADIRREAAAALCEAETDLSQDSKAVIAGLKDGDPGVRWWCAVALLGSSVPLKAIEEDLLLAFRLATTRALRDAGVGQDIRNVNHAAVRAMAAFRGVLAKRPALWRAELARGLEILGADLRPWTTELLAACKRDDVRLRRALGKVLGGMGFETQAPLIRALSNVEAGVRETAARALGRMQPRAKAAVTPLKNRLKDSSTQVRTQAALSLWAIEDSQYELALGILNMVIKDVDNKDRWTAIEAVGMVNAFARPPIRGLTEVLVKALKDKDAAVRVHAARWLFQKEKQAKVVVPLLREAATDRAVFLRLSVVETLGLLKDEPKVVPLLCQALEDRDMLIRVAALQSLASSGAFGPMREAMASKNPRVRLGLVKAVASLETSGQRGVMVLVDGLEDKHIKVKQAAQDAMKVVFQGRSDKDVKAIVDVVKAIKKLDNKDAEKAKKLLDQLRDLLVPKKVKPMDD